MEDNKEIINKYTAISNTYQKLSEKVANIIEDILKLNNVNYHAVTFRTKTIESFSTKSLKPKYDDPLNQITDLSGIRIIGYVEDDILLIQKLIEEFLEIDSENSLDKSKDLGIDKVGYKSIHYVCRLPNNRIALPEYRMFEKLKFEVQIRTILQHSWAEIEHDKDYKFSGELPAEIQRRFKLIAGSLEILDREFNQIAREIDLYSEKVRESTEDGKLDTILINSTSLKKYLTIKFKELIETKDLSSIHQDSEIEKLIINELNDFGVNNLEELDLIISKKIEEILKSNFKGSNFIGLLRLIMLMNDSIKYMEKCHNGSWGGLGENSEEILKLLNIDVDKINKIAEEKYMDR